jgi:hypothetical protein
MLLKTFSSGDPLLVLSTEVDRSLCGCCSLPSFCGVLKESISRLIDSFCHSLTTRQHVSDTARCTLLSALSRGAAVSPARCADCRARIALARCVFRSERRQRKEKFVVKLQEAIHEYKNVLIVGVRHTALCAPPPPQRCLLAAVCAACTCPTEGCCAPGNQVLALCLIAMCVRCSCAVLRVFFLPASPLLSSPRSTTSAPTRCRRCVLLCVARPSW